MFVVWGKKTVYRKLGHVADFCSICRVPSPFLLQRVGMARHLYQVSFGQGELVGYRRTCEKCDTSYKAERLTYKAVSKKPASVATLQRETFPDLVRVWSERLALEERVRRSALQLPAAERAVLIRDPFLLLAPKVEKHYGSMHFDKEVALSILAAIGLVAGGVTLAPMVVPDRMEMALGAMLLLGVVLVVSQMVSAKRRYLRREIVPALVRALRPLRPTQTEITSALAESKRLKHTIGAKLHPNELKVHLPSLRSRS